MNITGTSSYTTLSTSALQSTSSIPTDNSTDASSQTEGSQGMPGRHAHRGGHMHAAIDQALQSLGLTSQPQGASSTNGASTSGSADADNDGDGGGIRQDMHNFMHTLFEAIKADGSSSSAATTGASQSSSNSAGQGSNFASGLSALISDVSKGSGPTDLQNAFTKLMSDFQGNAGSTQSTAALSGSSSNSVTLQSLLTKLQDNLGYGSTGSASGGLISTAA